MDRQVICINWGTRYGAPYVNRLYGMVARQLTPPFRFICFTDSSQGFRAEIDAQPLPDPDFDYAKHRRGIWGKSQLWSERLSDLTGPVLFLDLDLVLTGPLDPFFEFGAAQDVILARNAVKPFSGLGQTSIYRFPVGKLAPLRSAYLAAPERIERENEFEQYYVSRNAPGGISFWPRGWVRHFRAECIPPVPLNYLRAPRLPHGTRVVIFPRRPNPPDALVGRWNERQEVQGPWAHIKATFAGPRTQPPLRHLRRYLRPTPWIADHWRE